MVLQLSVNFLKELLETISTQIWKPGGYNSTIVSTFEGIRPTGESLPILYTYTS